MIAVDGASVRRPLHLKADVVVVGSGPAGAAVARALARAGLGVVVVEEGAWRRPEEHPEDGFRAMARSYRDLGGTLTAGRAPMPLVQGRAVGGTSVVNGAISWRLPRDVHAEWLTADPRLEAALPWEEVHALHDEIEDALHIRPTDPAIAGPHNTLLARGAEALGIEHRPIARNTRGCRGLGRCLQGCPEGHKTSMDLTFLPEAVERGARILARVRVDGIEVHRGRAVGVRGRAAGGGRVRVEARRAVVLAASAVGTPLLLQRSGLGTKHTGRHLQCHPGAAVAGNFDEPVRMWTGATQGHEVIGLRRERLKFEALGYDLALVALRQRGVGRELARRLDRMDHQAHWGAAIRATTEGRVLHTPLGPVIRWSLSPDDVARVRRGVRVLGELFFAAGARSVEPGVIGWDAEVTDPRRMAAIESAGPADPAAYSLAATHLFGTCRMGSDPERSVVAPDFRVRGTGALYVADSSVFPSNTGVNPQTSILAVASLCARSVLSTSTDARPGLRSRLREWFA